MLTFFRVITQDKGLPYSVQGEDSLKFLYVLYLWMLGDHMKIQYLSQAFFHQKIFHLQDRIWMVSNWNLL